MYTLGNQVAQGCIATHRNLCHCPKMVTYASLTLWDIMPIEGVPMLYKISNKHK